MTSRKKPSLPFTHLDLTQDWVFKWMFGQLDHKHLLIDLLNTILADKEPPIIDLHLNNTEQIGESLDNRNVIFDIYCTTSDNTHLIIEVQNIDHPHYIDRTLAYAVTALNKQIKVGENWHHPFDPVYVISFINFIQFPKEPFFTHASLIDTDTHHPISHKLNLIFLELPKIQKNTLDYQNSRLHTWLYFIKFLGEMKTMPHQFITDDTFREIFRKANVANMTAQQVEDFIRQNKFHWNHRISLDVKYNEGLTAGKEEGIAIGKEEGIVIGQEKGREEEKLSTARKLKARGSDIALIHDITGLPIEIIDKL
ncbi:Rpn family recombination-promoting nuclease/putative transposase [Pelistega sp. MC2]|uniref:Rpn family recombination-promoting nuclease/putative transposase n=1 Tax=Pelistega sp. MC2 TaxID=1720297 RepID=UPI0009F25CD0